MVLRRQPAQTGTHHVMSNHHIRELNDAFRSTFRGGKVMMTS
jgi:hypothetical protein